MVKACNIAVFVVVTALVVACGKSGQEGAGISKDNLPAHIELQGDNYLIKKGNACLEINPAVGGRVSSLKYNKHELLVTDSLSKTVLWGSVLWPSPQSDWGWPPLEALDSEAYSVLLAHGRLELTSNIDKKTGYQIVKSYGVLGSAEDAFEIIYSIYNRSKTPKTVAPWELTRVPTRGMVLFPTGDIDIGSSIFYPLEIQKIDGISWFLYDATRIHDDHHKMMADAKEGWLAYVDQHYLFVKTFDDIPVELIANSEGEVELFTNARKTYLELQQQGGMTMLKPGEHLDWRVVWYVKKLPDNIAVSVGSEDLVAYIRALISSR